MSLFDANTRDTFRKFVTSQVSQQDIIDELIPMLGPYFPNATAFDQHRAEIRVEIIESLPEEVQELFKTRTNTHTSDPDIINLRKLKGSWNGKINRCINALRYEMFGISLRNKDKAEEAYQAKPKAKRRKTNNVKNLALSDTSSDDENTSGDEKEEEDDYNPEKCNVDTSVDLTDSDDENPPDEPVEENPLVDENLPAEDEPVKENPPFEDNNGEEKTPVEVEDENSEEKPLLKIGDSIGDTDCLTAHKNSGDDEAHCVVCLDTIKHGQLIHMCNQCKCIICQEDREDGSNCLKDLVINTRENVIRCPACRYETRFEVTGEQLLMKMTEFRARPLTPEYFNFEDWEEDEDFQNTPPDALEVIDQNVTDNFMVGDTAGTLVNFKANLHLPLDIGRFVPHDRDHQAVEFTNVEIPGFCALLERFNNNTENLRTKVVMYRINVLDVLHNEGLLNEMTPSFLQDSGYKVPDVLIIAKSNEKKFSFSVCTHPHGDMTESREDEDVIESVGLNYFKLSANANRRIAY